MHLQVRNLLVMELLGGGEGGTVLIPPSCTVLILVVRLKGPLDQLSSSL